LPEDPAGTLAEFGLTAEIHGEGVSKPLQFACRRIRQ
jgi:hypothetical protein